MQYSSDLWRCYDPQYYGGKAPEAADVDANGVAHYWRYQYIGQPFRKNEFDNDDNELSICTPALTNGALSALVSPVVLAVTALLSLVCTLGVLLASP